MQLTKQKLKQIIKEELENIQQEGMGMPSIKQIMQMDDCVKLMKLKMKLEDANMRGSAEYQVADARFEQVCQQDPGRYQDPETGEYYSEDDPEYGYYPPGFLEEKKDDA